jgi:co-chaperonin GroES (HSP10)
MYKPIRNNCIVKIANKLKETKSGIVVYGRETVNTEIYEIVALPDEVPDAYKELKVGDHFLAWKNWRGFQVGKDEDGIPLILIDLPDVAAIIEE